MGPYDALKSFKHFKPQGRLFGGIAKEFLQFFFLDLHLLSVGYVDKGVLANSLIQ